MTRDLKTRNLPEAADGRAFSRKLWMARFLAVSVPLVFWSVFLLYRWESGWHFTSDSVAYIQCARNILRCRGIKIFDYRWGTPNREVNMSLWPPGYPFLIAALSASGVSDVVAARVISALGFTAALIVCLLVISKHLSPFLTLMLGIGLVSIATCQIYATKALSEGAFVACVLVSTLLLTYFPPRNRTLDTLMAFGAGLFGGLAVSVRYAGLSFVAASVLFLAFSTILHKKLSTAIAWFLGLLTGCGWLFAYNLATFGRFIPYDMPPSTLGPLDNMQDALRALVGTMTPLFYAAKRRPWIAILTSLLLMIASCLLASKKQRWLVVQQNSYGLGRLGLFSLLFLSLYFVELVVARTKYEWGEVINSRHIAPVAWLIVLAFMAVIVSLAQMQKSAFALRIGVTFCCLLWPTQAFIHSSLAVMRDCEFGIESVLIQEAKRVAAVCPAGTVLADGRSRIYLSIFARRQVKYAPRVSRGEKTVTWDEVLEGVKSHTISCIVASELARDDIAKGNYGPVFQSILREENIPPGWAVEKYGAFRVLLPINPVSQILDSSAESEALNN